MIINDQSPVWQTVPGLMLEHLVTKVGPKNCLCTPAQPR